MKKISTLFIFDYENGVITEKARPENQWVLNGEGKATLKVDGTSCYVKNGKLYKRFDRKLKKVYDEMRIKKQRNGQQFFVKEENFRDLPEGAIPCVENYDPVTFHWPFWVPVGEFDYYHKEAFEKDKAILKDDQTYELIGPKVGKNKYNLDSHKLVEHGAVELQLSERTFAAIKQYIIDNNEEGIVFVHEDGRMCKIRRSDFAKDQTRNYEWKDSKPEDFN